MTRETLDAGSVPPSRKRYVITWPHDHATLAAGDIVVLVETPLQQNLLVRISDMTLHCLKDSQEQYVHLIELDDNENGKRTC